MTALERAVAQLMRATGTTSELAWDLRLDPYWRGIMCRVSALPDSLVEFCWDQLTPADQLKLTRAMFDAYRLGRAICGRGVA